MRCRARLGTMLKDETDSNDQTTEIIDEATLLKRLPICRRTLSDWRSKGIIPCIKVGRRCLYHWDHVRAALLRRQRGGEL